MNNGLLIALTAMMSLLLGVQVLVLIQLCLLNVGMAHLKAFIQTVVAKLDGEVELGGGLTWRPLKGLPPIPVEAPSTWIDRVPLVGSLPWFGR